LMMYIFSEIMSSHIRVDQHRDHQHCHNFRVTIDRV
jgi:hypothetical protein